MRRFSLFTIVLLCLAILVVDLLAFYWLQSITDVTTSNTFRRLINILFFLFTIGLVGAILTLKIRLENISEKRRHLLISSLYGLTVSSFIPKIIFIFCISLLYYFNYVFSDTQSKWIVPLVGLFSGFFPFFVILFAIVKTVYHFKIEKVKLQFQSLPKSFDPLRIVQISDIHMGSFNYKYDIIRKVVRTINSLEPDIIVFTGDLVNNYAWELDGWARVFKPLQAPLGKYAVLGNHDYGDYSQWDSANLKKENFQGVTAFFKAIDFTLLLNDARIVENKNEKIAIIGVEYWGKPPFKQYGDLSKAIGPAAQISFKILLTHDPTHWREEVLDKTDVALSLSGHTHGAQVGFNYRSKSWSPIKYKYEHWAGLYTINEQYLYVNRGLGWLGFPGRVGMRPEITCFDLYRSVELHGI